MFFFQKTAFLFVASMVLLAACLKDKGPAPVPSGPVCSSNKTSFTRDVKPIFDAHCATTGCHDATTKQSGVDLTSYAGSVSAVSGKQVVCHMRAATCTQMPPGIKLQDSLINKVEQWSLDSFCN